MVWFMAKSATFLGRRNRRFGRLVGRFVEGIGSLTWSQAVLFLLLPLVVLVYASRSVSAPVGEATPAPTVVVSVARVPVGKDLPVPGMSARQVFVWDKTSKMVLWQKSADERIYPASTTKMMTALVALGGYGLDKQITVTRAYPEGQNIGLAPGDVLTVEQLVYALLVQSANDAAEVLAENYYGGRAGFVEEMNRRAAELHLAGTHFLNPTGLDEDGHYSSAIDLARLADVALGNAEFARVVAVENSVITTEDNRKTYVLANINQLLGRIPGVKGVKSGQTDRAGQSLVTLVDRDNHPVLIVVLGSGDRFADSTALVNWVYANFDWVDPGMTGQQR